MAHTVEANLSTRPFQAFWSPAAAAWTRAAIADRSGPPAGCPSSCSLTSASSTLRKELVEFSSVVVTLGLVATTCTRLSVCTITGDLRPSTVLCPTGTEELIGANRKPISTSEQPHGCSQLLNNGVCAERALVEDRGPGCSLEEAIRRPSRSSSDRN